MPAALKKSQASLLGHTNKLRFFDRAAIVEINKKQSPWRLATVTQVEELKLILNMVPIWLTCLTFGTCVAQTPTFFIKQSSTLNRKISHNFEIPPATIYVLTAVEMIIAVAIYDKLLVPILRRITGNERGISILQRIGFEMIFSVLSMSIAALVERRRLGIVHKHGGKAENMLPMSVLWLAPQFMIIGVGDAFTLVGLQEYFYDQVPYSMRSLGIAFYLSVLGVGNFISSLLINVVNLINYCLYGYDAATHLTEEIERADRTGPTAILSSIGIITVFGWAYNFSLTFSIKDFNYLYDENNETAGALVPAQIIYDAFHGKYHNSAGAVVFLCIIWGSFFFCGLSVTTSAARVVSISCKWLLTGPLY